MVSLDMRNCFSHHSGGGEQARELQGLIAARDRLLMAGIPRNIQADESSGVDKCHRRLNWNRRWHLRLEHPKEMYVLLRNVGALNLGKFFTRILNVVHSLPELRHDLRSINASYLPVVLMQPDNIVLRLYKGDRFEFRHKTHS